jgi:geranylgeranyl pyrophosphate synthase
LSGAAGDGPGRPELLERAARACEPVLEALLAEEGVPADLRAAMRHAVLGAGKRLRPALVLGAAEAAGAADAIPRLVPAACAVELLHTYSLIHDDLPAMDDAELRRGRPACHRVFGEATAILAGDALQALAFEVLSRPLPGVPAERQIAAVAALARAAGPAGMCGGQALDLAAARTPPDDAGLWRLQAMKTGALLQAAVLIGAELGGATPEGRQALAAYGLHLGRAFQIVDDILDVVGDRATMGKATGGDARDRKPTVVSRFGLPEARRLAQQAAAEAQRALAPLGEAAEPLRRLAAYAVARDR